MSPPLLIRGNWVALRPLDTLSRNDLVASGACAEGVDDFARRHGLYADGAPTTQPTDHLLALARALGADYIRRAARRDGDGYGYGYGDGDGYGDGYGYGDGDGYGYGYGYGDGCGDGCGYGATVSGDGGLGS